MLIILCFWDLFFSHCKIIPSTLDHLWQQRGGNITQKWNSDFIQEKQKGWLVIAHASLQFPTNSLANHALQ